MYMYIEINLLGMPYVVLWLIQKGYVTPLVLLFSFVYNAKHNITTHDAEMNPQHLFLIHNNYTM